MFVKLLASFAPWIAFLIIARDTLGRVEFGLVAALVLSVVTAALRLQRGVIMWVGLAFFSTATTAVVGAHNMWVVRHLGVLANGTLAAAAWATLAAGRPFTLDYARAQTDPSLWHEPLFLRVNRLLTALWAATFTANTAIAWLLMKRWWPEWACHAATYALLIATAWFTSWYPGHVRRSRQRAEPA